MPVIQTSNNRVVADDPEPGDAFVQVAWFGPSQDGRHRQQFHGPVLPVERYDEAVAWARGMAEQMVHPLYVVPLTVDGAFPPERLHRLAAGMTDQERGELRRLVVTLTATIMRDCDEVEVREEAFGVLAKMGVVQQ